MMVVRGEKALDGTKQSLVWVDLAECREAESVWSWRFGVQVSAS